MHTVVPFERICLVISTVAGSVYVTVKHHNSSSVCLVFLVFWELVASVRVEKEKLMSFCCMPFY